MYVICVYDVDEKRCNKCKTLLRKYLFHVQKSVFEGELTPALYKELKDKLNIIIKNKDQVIFYFTYNNKQMYKNALGKTNSISNVIE